MTRTHTPPDSAHTPGPWWVVPGFNATGERTGRVVIAASSVNVALCTIPDHLPNAPSNARLIADAPELLAQLRAQGLHVENPAENPAENTAPASGQWLDYMRVAIPQLMRCDTVLMLPGWSRSRGARIELQLTLGLGLELMFADPADGLHNAGDGA